MTLPSLCGLLSAVVLVIAPALFAAQAAPNIVVIYTDDQGYGDISTLNPKSKFQTPNLDRLAREGLIFTDAHCGGTRCTPSRYALLTGRYPWRSTYKSGGTHAEGPCLIAKDRATVASMLKGQGYRTAMFGKWHLQMIFPGTVGHRDWSQPIRDGPTEHGFDSFFGIPASMNYGLLGFIRDNRFVEPPTVWSRMKRDPQGDNQRLVLPYDRVSQSDEDIEVAPSFRDDRCLGTIIERAIEFIDASRSGTERRKPFFAYLALTAPHLPLAPAPEFVGRSTIGEYGDFMLELDHRIGQVLAALERNGLARDTLVIVSSDNGAETHYRNRIVQHAHSSNGELKGGKRDIYEGGHRVPFIARWPAVISAGRRTAEVVAQTDLFATLAEIAGAKIPANAAEDSFSLLPVFKGEDYPRPLRAPLIHLSGNGFFSIRDGRWKLNLFRGSGGSLAPTFVVPKTNEPPFELYDMTEDWRETRNVHDQHPEVVARLKARATEFVRNGRSTPGVRQKNEGPELWPELTWIGGAPPLPAVPARKKARASKREGQ